MFGVAMAVVMAARSGDGGGGGGAEDEEDSHSWPTVNERSSELFSVLLYFSGYFLLLFVLINYFGEWIEYGRQRFVCLFGGTKTKRKRCRFVHFLVQIFCTDNIKIIFLNYDFHPSSFNYI